MYKILLSYSTGDSFDTEDTSDYLELSWNDLDIAKQNLKRIGEHYRVYNLYDKMSNKYDLKYLDKKDIDLFESRKSKDWFVADKDSYTERYSLILKTDAGKDWKISAFWCGYFEHLQSAEIVLDKSDLKITF
jgi:hypothetical protein